MREYKKKIIALVEDDEILSRVLCEELQDFGCTVLQAFNGESGLALIRSKKPDLVLLDLIMPKKHGLDVLAEMKENPDTKNIPVFILTMLSGEEDIKKGLQLGAQDYIVKSQHTISEIAQKIEAFFNAGQG